MNRTIALAVIAGLVLLAAWLHREHARGTFDVIESGFVSRLAANTTDKNQTRYLPPLTLVLYDEEASELAGTTRLALLDGTLFARAASRLGALAAGVEGIGEDPSRMIEAAEGMPVFGGYDWQSPPGQGWTPVAGAPAAGWPDRARAPCSRSRASAPANCKPGGPKRVPALGRGPWNCSCLETTVASPAPSP